MNYSKIILTIYFFSFFNVIFAQNQFVTEYFRSPIDYSLVLSGNFAQLRANHYHSGIDFKTDNKVGKPLFAVADGYVARINVSPFGYGSAIYLEHPNGYTSVYGHLNAFYDKVAEYVQNEHYKQQKNELTLYPNPDQFVLKKGELVAISGNTGHSFGPHLHFEFRHTQSENPMNTLLFGLPYIDNLKPRFFHLAVYPLTAQSRFLPETSKTIYPAKLQNLDYLLSVNQVVRVGEKTGFGVRVHDFMNQSPDRLGVYNLKMFLDDNLMYEHQIDQFSFDQTRYLNSHVDYELKKNTNKWTYKCFVEPNNKLPIFKTLKNNGIVELVDYEIHTLKFVATDEKGNTSKFEVKIQRDANLKPANFDFSDRTVMPFDQENKFEREGIKLLFPAAIFYDTIFFKFASKPKLPTTYSPLYVVHNENVPVHKFFNISVQTENLPKNLYSKALLVKISANGSFSAVESKIDELGIVSANVREFGTYAVAIDNVPPTIKPLNISDKKNVSAQKTIEFKLTDNLSGIAQYNAYIDEKWALLEYNYMKHTLTYKIDNSRIQSGEHKLVVIVSDALGNEKKYECTFFN